MKLIGFLPQLSNRSYDTGKWHILKDAHFRMMKNQLKAIESYSKDYEYIFFLPVWDQIQDSIEDFFYDLKDEIRKKINIDFFEFSKNVAFNRFHFNMNHFIKRSDNLKKIDILINDVPEITRNFKIFFNVHLKKEIQIISNVHYLDIYPETYLCGNESNYFLRQFDGLACSNKGSFLTQKNMDDFFSYAKTKILPNFSDSVFNKSKVLDYLVFSEDELNTFKTNKRKKKQILFISRCSDDKRTRWKFFIESCKKLRENRTDFEVILTNPSGLPEDQLDKEIGSAKDFISYKKNLSRIEYIKLLWESSIVPLLYDIGNNAAIGFFEAMYCDNIPIQLGVEYKDDSGLLDAMSISLDEDHNSFISRKEKFINRGSCERNSKRFFKEFIDDSSV